MSKVLFIRDIAMFPTFFIVKPSLSASIPVYAATAKKLDALVADLSPQAQNWLQASGWKAKDGQSCCLPDDQGHIERVLFCLSDETAASHFELANWRKASPMVFIIWPVPCPIRLLQLWPLPLVIIVMNAI
jgi:hypothetical protein